MSYPPMSFAGRAPIYAALLCCAALCVTPGEAGAQQKSIKEYASEFQPRLNQIGRQVQAVQRKRVSADELSPRRLVASLGRKRDPQSLFFWVRDEIAYEPYEGSLRGVRGTLMSRAGNSLDQALLLQELLSLTGVKKTRVAWGTLESKDVQALLNDFAGQGEVSGVDVKGASSYAPGRDRALVNAARDHYWVEAWIGRKWVAMDPSYSRSAYDNPPTGRKGESEGVPERGRIQATVKLFVEGADGRGRPVLALSEPLSELSNRNLTLTFGTSDKRGTTSIPRFEVAGKSTRGEGFQTSALKRMWVEFFFDRGGRSQRKFSRDLYLAESSLNIFEADQQVFSMLIVPGWLNPEFYTAVAQQELGALYTGGESMRKVVQAGVSKTVREAEVLKRASNYTETLISKAGGLMALTYASVADRTSLRMANKLGVRAFYDQPRVVIVGGFRKDDRLFWQIDLRNDSIRAVPAKGLPRVIEYAFQAQRGRFISQFEAAVVSRLTGKPVLSVYELFNDAVEAKIPVVTLVPENLDPFIPKMKISKEAEARLREEVKKNGKGVLAPAKGSKFGPTSVLVWWSLDPTNGAIIGMREDGTNGGFGEPLLTGEAPGRKKRSGNIEVLLFDEALTLLHSLSGTVGAMLRGEPNVCSVSCATAKDLVKLPTLMCVKGAARGAKKLPLDDEIAACLEPISGGGGGDIFGVSVGCDALVRPARCGSVMAVGSIVGRYQVKYTKDPVGPTTGPWKPKELDPYSLSACKCK